MSSTPAAAALAVLLLLGAAACGKDDAESPSGGPSIPAPSSSAPSSSADPSTPVTPGTATTSGAVGLPKTFPTAAVPVVPGVVTGKTANDQGGPGRKGWILELSASGSAQDCFDRAAAALTGAGFTKRGEMVQGGDRQAQFTTDRYAVIISADDDGNGLCRLGYEVGEVSR